MPIPPHDLASSTACAEDPYRRLSWIIPARGSSPWDGGTGASVLTNIGPDIPSADGYTPRGPSGNISPEIVWTHDSLIEFWKFLQSVRTSENHGSIGLAFHLASSPSPFLDSEAQHSHAMGSHKLTTVSASVCNLANEPSNALSSHPLPLNTVDHFRVFHDALYTHSIRNVLHLWSFRIGETKIRMLKGAKLALLDEISNGVMLC